ncbi:MAG: hypothetical protein RLZZ584_1452 [Pseudomonadota bacterium]|jgi:CRP-like cAMP-binding protein
MQIQIIGWVAAALTLWAFSMRTMIPLRMVSSGANCSFIVFGALSQNYPVLLLHCILLPFNAVRLVQMHKLVRKVQQASTCELDGDWLRPYAQPVQLAAGKALFHAGDPAAATYFLVEGSLRLPQIGEHITPGNLIGEIALFSASGLRTQTVVAEQACTLLRVDNTALRELYFQNPNFGFHLVSLVVRRLSADTQRLQQQQRAPELQHTPAVPASPAA